MAANLALVKSVGVPEHVERVAQKLDAGGVPPVNEFYTLGAAEYVFEWETQQGGVELKIPANSREHEAALNLHGSSGLRRIIHAALQEAAAVEPLVFEYTNWRGHRETRRVVPREVEAVTWGLARGHSEEGWLLHAYCLDRKDDRSFTLSKINQSNPGTGTT